MEALLGFNEFNLIPRCFLNQGQNRSILPSDEGRYLYYFYHSIKYKL